MEINQEFHHHIFQKNLLTLNEPQSVKPTHLSTCINGCEFTISNHQLQSSTTYCTTTTTNKTKQNMILFFIFCSIFIIQGKNTL